MNDTTQQIDMLRRLADGKDQDIRQIEAQYGSGTRPGWVSEELAMLGETARRYRLEADQLEEAASSLATTQDNSA